MFGYIVRKTEFAVAFVRPPLSAGMKPLWVPESQIESKTEVDSLSVSIDVFGESLRRMGTPVVLSIKPSFLAKPGIAESLGLVRG